MYSWSNKVPKDGLCTSWLRVTQIFVLYDLNSIQNSRDSRDNPFKSQNPRTTLILRFIRRFLKSSKDWKYSKLGSFRYFSFSASENLVFHVHSVTVVNNQLVFLFITWVKWAVIKLLIQLNSQGTEIFPFSYFTFTFIFDR